MEDTRIKKKVLVVDDDNNLNTVLVDMLNLSGFEATGAADGVEGLEKALAIHPDVIFLDLMMPKMGGWETLDKLREDAWGKTAKVIILTALENENYIAKGMEKNINGYLMKTSQGLEDIVKQVEAVLK
ncbi:hypothetical protein BH11PAT3_BH11PAT3_3550 [soil metagenome]